MATTAALPSIKEEIKIPAYLIKETLDGIPVYYKGYREVLNKTKKYEQIMADGLLQAVIKNWLQFLLNSKLDEEKYWVLAGEVGSHLSHKNNLAHDLTIFETSVLTPDKIQNKYADFPAKLIIEIDAEVEYGEGKSNEEYIHRKTQRVLDFGTEKVIWIFTQTQKIMLAEPGKDWRTFDWDRDVEVLDGVVFNLPLFLKKKKIILPR
ncbi:MAG TPA: Uma2 family endonuclease [Bacteroidetes bacterium]|nr:Uma2 family endonuclease [Bacteroidota bacterium]